MKELVKAESLESFLADSFPSVKRFGLAGCESLLPALLAAIQHRSVPPPSYPSVPPAP